MQSQVEVAEEEKKKLENEVLSLLGNVKDKETYTNLINLVDTLEEPSEIKDKISELLKLPEKDLTDLAWRAIEPKAEKIKKGEGLKGEAKRATDIDIVYPASGGKRTVGKGTLSIDLFTGEAVLPDGTEEKTSLKLENFGYEVAKKLTLDSDKNVTLSLDSGGKYEIEAGQIELTVKQGFRIVYIELTESTELNVWVSTNIESELRTTRPEIQNVDDRRLTQKIEYDSDENPVYVGEALPGAGIATTDSKWRIKKLTYDSNNNPTVVVYASDKFNKKWSERTSYTYS
ncbi:MAG: hypothetical protein KAS87_06485 [Candidatus Omnitrophica bacterium]|nr:hypothetical protein [Candidatus Omnitrophota bacterium]